MWQEPTTQGQEAVTPPGGGPGKNIWNLCGKNLWNPHLGAITLDGVTETDSVLYVVVGHEADRTRDTVAPEVAISLPPTISTGGVFTFAIVASEALQRQPRKPDGVGCWIETYDPDTRTGTAWVTVAVGETVSMTLPERWVSDLAGNLQADPVTFSRIAEP